MRFCRLAGSGQNRALGLLNFHKVSTTLISFQSVFPSPLISPFCLSYISRLCSLIKLHGRTFLLGWRGQEITIIFHFFSPRRCSLGPSSAGSCTLALPAPSPERSQHQRPTQKRSQALYFDWHREGNLGVSATQHLQPTPQQHLGSAVKAGEHPSCLRRLAANQMHVFIPVLDITHPAPPQLIGCEHPHPWNTSVL